jgi:hypothetical protein
VTAALIVVIAVALVAVAVMGWLAQHSSAALRRERARSLRQANRLRDAEDKAAKAAQDLARYQQLVEVAESRYSKAEESLAKVEAELHAAGEVALTAPGRVRGRSVGGQGRAPSSPTLAVMLQLEHVRLRREWLEVAGPGVDLPVPWDGSLASGVAIELAVIREVIGTPSDMSVTASGPLRDPVALRAACELLRALARSGDEMTVVLSDEALSVAQYQDHIPDVSELQEAAEESGMALFAGLDGERVSTRLVFDPS